MTRMALACPPTDFYSLHKKDSANVNGGHHSIVDHLVS